MGHEVPGMRGLYSPITPGMHAELKAGLEELRDQSLRERTRLAPTSRVAVLDELLTRQRELDFKIRSQSAPRIWHRAREVVRRDPEAGL